MKEIIELVNNILDDVVLKSRRDIGYFPLSFDKSYSVYYCTQEKKNKDLFFHVSMKDKFFSKDETTKLFGREFFFILNR